MTSSDSGAEHDTGTGHNTIFAPLKGSNPQTGDPGDSLAGMTLAKLIKAWLALAIILTVLRRHKSISATDLWPCKLRLGARLAKAKIMSIVGPKIMKRPRPAAGQ